MDLSERLYNSVLTFVITLILVGLFCYFFPRLIPAADFDLFGLEMNVFFFIGLVPIILGIVSMVGYMWRKGSKGGKGNAQAGQVDYRLYTVLSKQRHAPDRRENVTDMSKDRIIKVECQCGQLLFRYFKGGRGRLIKCYLDQIQDDGVGVVNAPLGARPACPACGKAIGIVQMVRGRPALKLNQGAIQKIRI